MQPIHLQINYPDGHEQELTLSASLVVIGSAADSGLVLRDKYISPQHAQLRYRDGSWYLCDIGSANGTYLDGERLFAQELHQLANGSRIRIGGITIAIGLAPAAAGVATAVLLPETPATPEAQPASAEPTTTMAAVPAAPLPADTTAWWLTITHADGRRETIGLRGETFRIGRERFNDLVISGNRVSRQHALLSFHDQRWSIRDLGSSNGTLVDGEPLHAQDEQVLDQGCSIQIGDLSLILNSGVPTQADTADPAAATPELLKEMAQLLAAPPAPATAPGVAAEPPPETLAPPDVWQIQVAYRNGLEHELDLTGELFAIGHGKDNQLVLNDGSVSRYHAQLIATAGGWQIRNLGGVNGTLVDDLRLPIYARHTLADGSRVTIGSTTLVLRRKVWQLHVTLRGNQRQVVDLTHSPFRIGRTNDNDLEINDGLLSDHHVELVSDGHSWQIFDLDSKDGTYVDSVRLISQYPHPLASDSSILIGKTRMVLRLGTPAPAVAPAAAAPDVSAAPAPVAPATTGDMTADLSAASAPTPVPAQTARPTMPLAPEDLAPAPAPTAELRLVKQARTTLLSRAIVQPLRRGRTIVFNTLGITKVSTWARTWTGIDVIGEMGGALKRSRPGETAPPADTAAELEQTSMQAAPATAISQPTTSQLARSPAQQYAVDTVVTSATIMLPESAAPLAVGAASSGESAALPMRVTLTTTALRVEPGGVVSAAITIANRSSIVDRIFLAIAGIPPEWVTITPPSISLMPGGHAEAQIVIAPPKSPASKAGAYYIAVAGRSEQFPEALAIAEGALAVAPYTEFRLDLQPKQRIARRHASYRVDLTNTGNRLQTFQLQASDDEQAMGFSFARTVVTIQPGQSARTRLDTQATSRHLYGPQKILIFNVQAAPADQSAQPQQAIGRLVQRPLLTCLLLVLLALSLIACAGGSGLLWFRDPIRLFLTAPQRTVTAQTAAALATLSAQTTVAVATAHSLATEQAAAKTVTVVEYRNGQTATSAAISANQTATIAANQNDQTATSAAISANQSAAAAAQTATSAAIAVAQTATLDAIAVAQTATAATRPTVAPTPTVTPTLVVFRTPTPRADLLCSRGVPTAIFGSGPRNTEVLLLFKSRVVTGGRSGPDGRFALTLIVGDEPSGVYPVTVRERATGRTLRQLYCQVP